MTTIVTHSELQRKALEFVLHEKARTPDKSWFALVDEAGQRFNLSPVESASLLRVLTSEYEK